MQVQLAGVSPSEMTTLLADIENKGYACVPNYIQAGDLDRMRSFVHGAVARAGNEYAFFSGPEEVSGSGLEDIYESPSFTEFMHELYRQGSGREAPDQEFYHVLRCLSGSSGAQHSRYFHFDSYFVTALIPIEIPTEGMTGDLILFPNLRKVRSIYALNVLDKLILDFKPTQKILQLLLNRKVVTPTRIKLQPGNLYLFWGYRSLHTNEPCDPDKIRATALFHYANPHKH